MANINEWMKGISFFIFVTILYYFFWTNIFSNIIIFVGTDIFNIGAEASSSISILKTITWISFIMMYLTTAPLYLIYSFFSGSQSEVETHPLCFLIAIGLWCIVTPILSFIYGLLHFLLNVLNASNIMDSGLETGLETTATQFSWIIGLIVLLGIVALPFYYILKGYGQLEKGGYK